jgi:hypothetical protein
MKTSRRRQREYTAFFESSKYGVRRTVVGEGFI